MKKMKLVIAISFIDIAIVGVIFNVLLSALGQSDFLNCWQILFSGILMGCLYFMCLLIHTVKTSRLKAIVWAITAFFVFLYGKCETDIATKNGKTYVIFLLGISVYTLICSEIVKNQAKDILKENQSNVINSGNDGEFTHDQDNDGE